MEYPTRLINSKCCFHRLTIKWQSVLVALLMDVRFQRRGVSWRLFVITLTPIRFPRRFCDSFWSRFNSHTLKDLIKQFWFLEPVRQTCFLHGGFAPRFMLLLFILLNIPITMTTTKPFSSGKPELVIVHPLYRPMNNGSGYGFGRVPFANPRQEQTQSLLTITIVIGVRQLCCSFCQR